VLILSQIGMNVDGDWYVSDLLEGSVLGRDKID
jgi:hypothetical protein